MFIRHVVTVLAVVVMPFARPVQAHVGTATLVKQTTSAVGQRVQQAIREQYGIIMANRLGTWSSDELVSVRAGLDAIALEFSAIAGHAATSSLRELLSGVVVYRDHGADRIAYTAGWTVSMSDLWATDDQIGRTFYLAHEVGHLLDTRTSLLHHFMGEISSEFARAIGAYTDEQGRYQPGLDLPYHDALTGLRHRTDNATEDWAESFASVMVPEFKSSLRDSAALRLREVIRHFVEWADISGSLSLPASVVEFALDRGPDADDHRLGGAFVLQLTTYSFFEVRRA